jgi:nucleotide sugar dehydrogenase
LGGLAELGVRVPVLLRSTVPPGTTAGLARRWPDLRLVFHPEFLRERHHLDDAASPARVVLGWSDGVESGARQAVHELYRRRFPETPRIDLDATSAELLKYTSNALFGVKVSFANEMAELAGRLGVDWEPVRRALVLDPRVGDGHLCVPGPDGAPGFGGSCLPKDMSALLALAAGLDVPLDVVEAAIEANRRRRSVAADTVGASPSLKGQPEVREGSQRRAGSQCQMSFHGVDHEPVDPVVGASMGDVVSHLGQLPRCPRE